MRGGSAASTSDVSACSAAHSAGVEGVAPPPVGQTGDELAHVDRQVAPAAQRDVQRRRRAAPA